MFTMKIDHETSEVVIMTDELDYMRFKYDEYNVQRIKELVEKIIVGRKQRADLEEQYASIIQKQKEIDQTLGYILALIKDAQQDTATRSRRERLNAEPIAQEGPCGGIAVRSGGWGYQCDACSQVWPENKDGPLRIFGHNS